MDIMDSSRRTDRASEKAREALVDVVGHPLLSSEEDASVIEVSDWIDGYADPSAGDFVGVLRALDGEIAVEICGETHDDEYFEWYVYYDVERDARDCAPFHGLNKHGYQDWETREGMEDVIRIADSVRLLHRDDTEELPLAVQEAMEGDG